MERVRAVAENPAVANGGDDIHPAFAVPLARPLAWRLRLAYLFVLVPMMATCAGLLDGPWAAGFAYAALLIGVGSIWRAMLAPRPLERRVQPQEGRAVVNAGHGNPEAAIAWCGYVLVAAPVMGTCYGLADTPGAALVSYASLLLGVALIGIAMLPLRPMERILQEERNRAVRNGSRQGEDEVIVPRARGMDWTGYQFVAGPVLANWAGLVEGPPATFFTFALLLLGVAFTIIAMLALAKPKMA